MLVDGATGNLLLVLAVVVIALALFVLRDDDVSVESLQRFFVHRLYRSCEAQNIVNNSTSCHLIM